MHIKLVSVRSGDAEYDAPGVFHETGWVLVISILQPAQQARFQKSLDLSDRLARCPSDRSLKSPDGLGPLRSH